MADNMDVLVRKNDTRREAAQQETNGNELKIDAVDPENDEIEPF
jgi:hypothetical protein